VAQQGIPRDEFHDREVVLLADFASGVGVPFTASQAFCSV
jgi:hypothetical protein